MNNNDLLVMALVSCTTNGRSFVDYLPKNSTVRCDFVFVLEKEREGKNKQMKI